MGRSPCCDKASVKRGPWSQEEDAVLRSFVERFGNAGNWITLPQKAGLKRCGKSCRLRWLNYLRPALRHGGFTEEEDTLILSLYGEIGSKWSVIAAKLPGRTDNDVKNYWNTKLKKRYSPIITREITTPPPPPPTGGDSIATTADTTSELAYQLHLPLPPPPALVNLETADGSGGGGELTHKSEQLYAELMELIEQQYSVPSTSPSSSSSPFGTSPAGASSFAGSGVWPLDVVHDTALLPAESSRRSGLLEFDCPCGAHAPGAAASWHDSFQDLLASSYDETIATQELMYH